MSPRLDRLHPGQDRGGRIEGVSLHICGRAASRRPARTIISVALRAHGSRLHRRRRGRIPDRRSRHLGAALARLRAARVERAGASAIRSSARCTSRSSRSAPRSAPTSSELDDEIIRIRRELRRRGRARRPAHRRRRHASVLELDGSGHLARRALREHRRGAAAAGALAADLRPARPRRRARSLDDDRPDERGALLPAAPAGAVDQLAVLDGARHRPEVVPHDGVPPVSAHRHPRSLRLVERVRGVRRTCSSSCTASTTARRSGGTCGRIRRSARSSSASATCRRAPRATIAIAALAQAIVVKLYRLREQQPRLPPLSPRADRGEQVARRALGHRRQADRLRQAPRGADARARRWSCSSSSTTWWTSWAAGGRSSTCTTILREGTSAERQLQVYRETGDLRAVVRLARRRNARRRRAVARRRVQAEG